MFLIAVIYAANMGMVEFKVFAWVNSMRYGDKISHFLLLGTMAFLLNLALGLKDFKLFRRTWLLGSGILFFVIFLEECSQYFIPNRNFDLMDMLCNTLGILCFGFIAKLVGPYLGIKSRARGKETVRV